MALPVVALMALSCAKESETASGEQQERTADDPAASAGDDNSASTSDATKLPIEAPPGTVVALNGQLLVQTCDEEHPCIDALHGKGAEHCGGFEVESFSNWRLPTKDEVHAFANVDGAQALEGYHWTATPDQANPAMFWIADPKGTQPTTLPPDRKPFRIRCVHDVAG